MSHNIAQLLFPDITQTIDDCKKIYPDRPDWTIVTRFSPSPTGFLHIGWVYSALVASQFAHQHNGVFFLRIEDTDQKRLIENGIDIIINGLNRFGIKFDEWPMYPNAWYGPYIQSQRKQLYHIFCKQLVKEGKAYPCRMSPEQIEETRTLQTAQKKVPGIYSWYSIWRDKSEQEIIDQIATWAPYVIRLKAPYNPAKKVTINDLIKWSVTTQDNFIDHVLLKSNGIPTYHFAHLVDDYLMGTTHVIRGDERFASLPLHIQLFSMMWLKAPQYAHIAPILKFDQGKKRKLSKRHDPESNIEYFLEQGFPVDAVKDFLMNIIDPSFEERRKEHADTSIDQFAIKLSDMNKSWALFDIKKLLFISTEYISKLSHQQFFDECYKRASYYHPECKQFFDEERDYAFQALNIERLSDNDPKRFSHFATVPEQILFFRDAKSNELYNQAPVAPSNIDSQTEKDFCEYYIQHCNRSASREERFEQLKQIWQQFWFAVNNQEFKQWWYKGKIWDLAMLLRIKLCYSTKTPDLRSVMQVMGPDRVKARLLHPCKR